ncbi:unnamed protein product, partial [Strongylus vulgaris]
MSSGPEALSFFVLAVASYTFSAVMSDTGPFTGSASEIAVPMLIVDDISSKYVRHLSVISCGLLN